MVWGTLGSIAGNIASTVAQRIPGIIVDKWLGGPSPNQPAAPLPAPAGTAVVPTPTTAAPAVVNLIDGGGIAGTGGTMVPAASVGQMVSGRTFSEGFAEGVEGSLAMSRLPRIPGSGIPAVLATGGRIRAILAKARAHTGMPMTTRKIIGLIREFGPYVAGGLLGLAIEELAEIWQHGTRRRRRRWTKRDMARARAYIRHLQQQEKQLNELRPRRRATRRTVTSTRGVTQIKN